MWLLFPLSFWTSLAFDSPEMKRSVRFYERFKPALTTLLPGSKSKEFCSSFYYKKKKKATMRESGPDQFLSF